ncbi:cupin-like domain-containing protein, partial [Alteromonas sp. 14N.309.X.WAT.G.H12]|uniref:cupin-like domain-containing protein n=1 Tax=Alteromonas sp. 14N.309.X.WAT.G.H12 TaxID=3120824 RepID=UPI002FD74392
MSVSTDKLSPCLPVEEYVSAHLHRADFDLADTLSGLTTPCVFRGLVNHWPVVHAAKQSDEKLCAYLSQFDHNALVDTLNLPASEQGRMFYNKAMNGFNFTRTRMPFRQALEHLLALTKQEAPDSLYVGSTTVDTCLPGFQQTNAIGLDGLAPLATLWIGNKSRIAAHYDAPDNLICVTAGKRRVTLFPPEQVENLYIGPLHFTPAGQAISLVDFANPDFDKHPKFKEALKHAQVVELNPGDALYIPSMWWHHIEGLANINMLVNFWWRTIPPYIGRAENVLYHALLTLKQLPQTQRDAWQKLFDFYVFSEDDARFSHI